MTSLRTLFVVLTILISSAASAETPSMTESPMDLAVWSATHRGELRGDHVEWHSRYDSATHVAPDRQPRLIFAEPLPAGTVVKAVDGKLDPALEIDMHGRVTAVIFHSRSYGVYELRTTVPAESGFEPPLVPKVAQRIALDGARVRPNSDSPLELRLTDIRHRGVSSETADRLEERWGEAQGASRSIFVLPDRAYFDSGGLSANIRSEAEAQKKNIFGLSALVIVVLGGLVILLGRFWRVAKAEEAEAFLREFDPRALDT